MLIIIQLFFATRFFTVHVLCSVRLCDSSSSFRSTAMSSICLLFCYSISPAHSVIYLFFYSSLSTSMLYVDISPAVGNLYENINASVGLRVHIHMYVLLTFKFVYGFYFYNFMIIIKCFCCVCYFKQRTDCLLFLLNYIVQKGVNDIFNCYFKE